jgi:hypothetical protein
MKVPVPPLLWIALALVAAGIWWLFQTWQPDRQVELHTLNLLKRFSARDWPAVKAMMADDYRDAWGQDREMSVEKAMEVTSHFFALQVSPFDLPVVRRDNEAAAVDVKLGIFGSGTPVAHAVMDAVRGAEGPFFFHWRKCGVWPWQWELVAGGHAGLAAEYGGASW